MKRSAPSLNLAFELSGEHPTLPAAEAATLVEAYGGAVVASDHDRVLLAKDAPPNQLALRLAMSHRVIERFAEAPLDADTIAAAADLLPLDGERFEVRCSRLSPTIDKDLSMEITHKLGGALAARGTVDLRAPEVSVRVLLDRTAVIGIQRALVDRSAFEARHVEERAFFSPISLHPRLARALVNLSGTVPGERVWDPFCGTGGLVLEAALLGLDAHGSDLDARMVDGTRGTLAQFETTATLEVGDVADVARRLDQVEAIVTDPPYGRSSSTHQEEVGQLYARFFRACEGVLAADGRIVVVLPRESDIDHAGEAFKVEAVHPWFVHRTLTRFIHVLQWA